ncbi:ABC transporter ATP-binding protein [Nonomuraea spiralis]|uniref:ABC transporter ATP-binding protein n=1 Tax=Nonomuraea spiralis TaxID=46182 RepID=A0ABV5IW62_9ACTN|nr:ABC transporter ATP-binding protein [Nonomuraea spiralis]
MDSDTTEALVAAGIVRVRGTGRHARHVLRDVGLTVRRGEFAALMGPSGSGKSTLLNCLAGLDRPDSGTVRIGGTCLTNLDEAGRTAFRRENLGFVFQDYGLFPNLTVAENIELPARAAGSPVDPAWRQALLARTGVREWTDRRPGTLSGGQQQRVAIARALLTRPRVVIADEPTGALDTVTSAQVLRLLRGMVDEFGQTVIMVTHDPVAAATADTVHFLAGGTIVETVAGATARTLALRLSDPVDAA